MNARSAAEILSILRKILALMQDKAQVPESER